MLGGVLIGIIEALASFIPDTNTGAVIGLPHGGAAWHGAIIFAILILILVFRPSGLLGERTPEKV
jgi:branched-chain amino acid transport system permease protein